MKMISRVLMTAVAVAALAAPAMAADKLIVQNTGSGTAFKVDDAGTVTVRNAGDTADVFTVNNVGTVTGAKLGMGTITPQSPLHLNVNAAAAVGTQLYDGSGALSITRADGSAAGDFITADSTAIAGKRGIVRGIRARGSLASPTSPSLNDYVLSVLGGVWTGQRVYNATDISMIVDGTITDGGSVATTVAPVRITFSTRTGSTWYERMTVKSNGNIGISTPDPKSILHVTGLPVYADNATAKAALGGTVAVGAFYTDGAGNVKVVY